MATNISRLLEERVFVTNAGTETYLVFQQGFELPEFCAFLIHEDESAWVELEQRYLYPILDSVANSGHGLLLDALVWRAHPDFIAKLGRDADELGPINARAVQITRRTVDGWRQANGYDQNSFPVLISADIGPRGDGYQVEDTSITAQAACEYHQAQMQVLAAAKVDLVCAYTMTTVTESIGIVQAASASGLPIIVSPTVETDGRLPDGTPLGKFVEQLDKATNSSPLFYMVNCAHPTHIAPTLETASENNEAWLSRFRGFRANASAKSHEELDNSTELDRGDVDELGREMAHMQSKYNLRVIGGCCGTDHEHIAAMTSRSSCNHTPSIGAQNGKISS